MRSAATSSRSISSTWREMMGALTELALGGSKPKRLEFDLSGSSFNRLTHYLFRYPAKFHPPVVRNLIENYSNPGQTILDPFVGSGTALIEAVSTGRNGIGIDVDPVAVSVASVKVRRWPPAELRAAAATILDLVKPYERPADEYRRRMFRDLSDRQYANEQREIRPYIPNIPNIEHWFRRYVVVDLARIRRQIAVASIPPSHRCFFEIMFASIIRNVSKADPVPVSGLEVTAHMKRRDEQGRLINPFSIFRKMVTRGLTDTEQFYGETNGTVSATVMKGDAAQTLAKLTAPIDVVITSPPYHGAVDYYRRHKLEMFWLGFMNSQQERIDILRKYIGRPNVPKTDPYLRDVIPPHSLAAQWERRIRLVSEERANAFHYYVVAMVHVFSALAGVLQTGAPAIFVLGHSTWNGTEIPTTALFQEISRRFFRLQDVLYYPVKNRYMSYTRHNGADIGTEYILVLKRRSTD